MAASIVTFFIEKLSQLISQEANLLIGVGGQIDSLRNELEWIRSVLRDADGGKVFLNNERARIWVNQVRSISYEAEDVIDEFISKVKHQHQRGRGRWINGPSGSFCTCSGIINTNQLKLRHNLGNEIEAIKKRIEEVSANKSKYGIETFQFGDASSSSQQTSSWRQSRRVPLVEEVDVVEMENERDMLVRQLIEGEPRLSILSIVGMGGLGKTTLATKVYNNNDVLRHFDFRAWITISQEYKIRELMEDLLGQIAEFNEKQKRRFAHMSDQQLQRELFGYLKERKYLVVVDDIWRVQDWDILKGIFPEATRGSRVMLTTRNREVALHADEEITLHQLRFLSEEECWMLFCRKALPKNISTIVLSPELQKVGRDIVGKCGGLPLAVVVIAGLLLRKDRIPREWAKVLKRISGEGHDQITQILALSYDDLPYYLKPCFLCLGVFPEDCEIPAKKAIHLWVAEGLVRQRGNETMEEVAEEYLEELIDRSMVQLMSKRYSGEIRRCRIHDMVRNLSIRVAAEDMFLDIRHGANFGSPVGARRLTVYGYLGTYISLNRSCPTPHLRSFLCHTTQFYPRGFHQKYWRFLIGGFRLLRVLDLPNMKLSMLPSEIGEMIHLRYLGLRGNTITSLPKAICNLVLLQTLDIKQITYLNFTQIPGEITEMDQLRHLYLGRGEMKAPLRIGNLRNLQTLSTIKAGSWIEDGLDQLTNLRKLKISSVSNSHREGLSNSIVHLKNLQSLKLSTRNDDGHLLPTLTFSNHVDLYKLYLGGRLEKFPDFHGFPQIITILKLWWSCLIVDPMVTLEKLPHLRTLELLHNSYQGKTLVCSAGGFLELQELKIQLLPEFEEWRIGKGAMPSIKHVSIDQCDHLKMLPEGLQYLTMLKKLELRGMGVEFIKRILPKDEGEDWYKIQHVPSILINDYWEAHVGNFI